MWVQIPLARMRVRGGQSNPGRPTISLAPTDLAVVITVDEARASQGLGPLSEDGGLTITEYKAKHSAVISDAADADAGQSDDAPKTE